jgi:hypothetical protein
MIDLQTVVWAVVYLLVAGGVFGLLFFLTHYLQKEFPSEPMSLFAKCARVLLVVLAVLVLIGILVSLVSGTPLFYWRSPGPPRP